MSPSSAPASPACGPPTTSRRPTRTCASPCWSARSPGSAPPDATAAGATPRSPGHVRLAAKTHGRRAVIDQQRALHQTVYEIARVVGEEGIDARFHLGGQLDLALTPGAVAAPARRGGVRALLGLRRGRLSPCSAPRTCAERIKVAGCLGAGYTPHGAAVDPARLARGLADVVERLGVPIYERTPVTRLEPHVATTVVRRRARRRRRARHRGVHPRVARLRADARTHLLADDRHRAAARTPSGKRSGGRP